MERAAEKIWEGPTTRVYASGWRRQTRAHVCLLMPDYGYSAQNSLALSLTFALMRLGRVN